MTHVPYNSSMTGISEHKAHIRREQNFGALYAAMIFLSLHWAIVVYVNSSYLEQFIPGTVIGTLYTISSAVTILIFLFISRVLHAAGNYSLTLSLAVLECVVLVGMACSDSLRVSIPLFMVHQAIVPLLVFNLDVFMEEMIGDEEQSTGGKRGLFLGIGSIAYAIAPLAAGYLMGDGEPQFNAVYIAGALLMVPFIILIMRKFRVFSDPVYQEVKVLPAIHSFWSEKNIRYVFLAHFLLQLFFAFMIIYTPLYLANIVGFDWTQIGLILFVGLLAYVFLEYPIGVIADRYIGEKEMMAFGFLILAVSTSWFVWLSAASVTAWMVAMFMTRVGASFVEATTESYFFKHIDGSDANIISFFRITRPLAMVGGALLGSLTLLYVPLNLLFVIVGLLMIPGLFFTMMLQDTK